MENVCNENAHRSISMHRLAAVSGAVPKACDVVQFTQTCRQRYRMTLLAGGLRIMRVPHMHSVPYGTALSRAVRRHSLVCTVVAATVLKASNAMKKGGF